MAQVHDYEFKKLVAQGYGIERESFMNTYTPPSRYSA